MHGGREGQGRLTTAEYHRQLARQDARIVINQATQFDKSPLIEKRPTQFIRAGATTPYYERTDYFLHGIHLGYATKNRDYAQSGVLGITKLLGHLADGTPVAVRAVSYQRNQLTMEYERGNKKEKTTVSTDPREDTPPPNETLRTSVMHAFTPETPGL